MTQAKIQPRPVQQAKPLTEAEKKARIMQFLQQKREQFAINCALHGSYLVLGPAFVEKFEGLEQVTFLYGEEWLDCVNNVIFENYHYFADQLGSDMEMTSLEGSYLLFLNLGKYAKKKNAAEVLKKECGLLVNDGATFAKGYDSWVRINLATSMKNIRRAVRSIKKLIK